MTSPALEPESRRARILVLVAIVLLAVNLRVAVGSLGVLLPAVRQDLAMSTTIAGVLTTLPVLCFAFFGATTNSVVRKVGLHRTAALMLVLITIGLVVRSLVDSQPVFILASAVALAGGAVGNVILPPLAKLHFPRRISTVSALYGASIMAGGSVSSLFSVPFSDAGNGWRTGLAAWAVLAALTLLPWLGLLRHDVKTANEPASRYTVGVIVRSPIAWTMALLFGAQAAQAYAQFGWLSEIYVDAGLSDATAANLMSIIPTIGIPLTLALPYIMEKVGDRPVLPWSFGVCTIVGWLGVMLAPATVPWLWAVLLGLGGAAFTWILAMIGHRSRTPDGTSALSSFVQGLGYVCAAAGPFGTGLLHDLTGSWTPPLIGLCLIAVLIIVLGTLVCRPQKFEDTLRQP